MTQHSRSKSTWFNEKRRVRAPETTLHSSPRRGENDNKVLIEGFGGKRALGFLLKSELCQKRSKFCMQFCLRVSNNVLHVFSLKFASFSRYYVCKKPCICCDVST